ncbi:MAG TPA: DUF4956 domain-containing protein [Clostridiaceae bacterium]|jgi:uncharacterized membrane protein YhiD involved in acid resistance|nr:DUF4956 domain-containing protein [Clostridiaceae bacterium]
MRETIYEVLQQSGSLETKDIIIRLLMSVLIGIFIMLSYKISHSKTLYSKKFNVSLFMLTILTTMVMTAIGNNIALSLGMVGALSIVRFRTAIKDSRDTVYIFWSIIIGICCGVGDYTVASVGTSVVFLALLIIGGIKSDSRMLLIVRSNRINELNIESIVYNYYDKKAILRVKNTSPETVEFIYELSKSIQKRAEKKEKSITEELYELSDVEYVNLVEQNDEIGS